MFWRKAKEPFVGKMSDAPEWVNHQKGLIFAYLVKRFGPFSLPPMDEIAEEVDQGLLKKHVVRDAEGKIVGIKLEFEKL